MLINFPPEKVGLIREGGLFERGRGLDRGFTVYIKRTLSSAKNILKQIIHI